MPMSFWKQKETLRKVRKCQQIAGNAWNFPESPKVGFSYQSEKTLYPLF